MRALWDAYGAWTYMVIVSFVGNLPNFSAEQQVVLQNQLAIGNAVKPYYRSAAGNKLNKAAQGPHPLRGKGPRRRQVRPEDQARAG